MSSRTAGGVMLFIDADNVSADVIEQAVQRTLVEQGALLVRRAYCTPEVAARQRTLFKSLGVRAMVNLATGKNSTDIALAVDAIDLVCAERPAVVVIVSSDADFSPLVIKLREKGCRVLGIGQARKTGEDTPAAYDGFIDLAHRRALPAPPPPAAAPAAKRPRRSAKQSAAAAAPVPDEVLRLLDALPALRNGEPMELNVAAERLRAAGLLAKRGSSTKLFGLHAAHFELAPARQPNRVRWRGTAPAG
jgi:uncharacterized protein (TIGR00288 family)